MKCPHCSHPEDHVIDSRPVDSANLIRRRRECLSCGKRFTTYERCEAMPLIVIKSDNRREPFSREKLKEGLSRAFEKREISADQIEKLVTEVEQGLQEQYVLEAPSKAIGELVLAKLKEMDEVAYIRVVSVYKQFSDIDSFLDELHGLKAIKSRKRRTKTIKVANASLSVDYSQN
jgi:transcriptional repressor NrdR